jgi:hypothetical protein
MVVSIGLRLDRRGGERSGVVGVWRVVVVRRRDWCSGQGSWVLSSRGSRSLVRGTFVQMPVETESWGMVEVG